MSNRIIKPVTDEEELTIQRGIDQDPDARELTDAEWRQMRPAAEVLPEIFGAQAAEALMRRRGRPALPITKVAVNVRYDQDVIDAFKADGDGWQTRMNAALREWAGEHGLFDKQRQV